jgi:putative transferase (TIGR04331 family)
MYGLPPRFDCFPTMMNYRRAKSRFIGGLPEEAFGRLRYRQYPSEHTFSDFEWLLRNFPKLQAVEAGPLIETLSRSALVVLDHPSTTLCQAMGGDIPMIGYWDWEAWPLTAQAEPVFAELERVGILFRNPEAAAKQVDAVWRDSRRWWNEPERQRVRTIWCKNYALTDRHCWLSWLKRLPAI